MGVFKRTARAAGPEFSVSVSITANIMLILVNPGFIVRASSKEKSLPLRSLQRFAWSRVYADRVRLPIGSWDYGFRGGSEAGPGGPRSNRRRSPLNSPR